jgi:hypothetical protein
MRRSTVLNLLLQPVFPVISAAISKGVFVILK